MTDVEFDLLDEDAPADAVPPEEDVPEPANDPVPVEDQ